MVCMTELGAVKPVGRVFVLAIGHILATKDTKRKHLLGSQIGGKSIIKILANRRSELVAVVALHEIINHNNVTHTIIVTYEASFSHQ